MKWRHTEEQIIGFLLEADAGLPVKELCREAWLQQGELLRRKGHVRRHERVGRAAAQGAGGGEHRVKNLLGNSMLKVDAMARGAAGRGDRGGGQLLRRDRLRGDAAHGDDRRRGPRDPGRDHREAAVHCFRKSSIRFSKNINGHPYVGLSTVDPWPALTPKALPEGTAAHAQTDRCRGR